MNSPGAGVSPFRGSYRSPHIGAYSLHKTPHNKNMSYTPHSSKAFSPATGSMLMQRWAIFLKNYFSMASLKR